MAQQKISSIKIRNFSGLNSVTNETDLQPGALVNNADCVTLFPKAAITFGPAWATAWGRSTLGANITTALAGADITKSHFVTLTRSGYTFLIAWDLANSRSRGVWQVAGVGDPSLGSGGGSSISAPSSSPYRNYTAGLNFYGSRVQNQLWIGNGTDANIAWVAGALTLLGPQTLPTNPQDPSQYVFPPCITWLPGPEGQVYGAGNVTYPTRVWCSEPPSINFPTPNGIKTTAYSYLDTQTDATAITGMSSFGRDLVAHFNIGPPFIISGYNGSSGGWKLQQGPTSVNASAINPNCTRDTKLATTYLGTDLEFYLLPTFRGSITGRGYNKGSFRDGDIVTKKAQGTWNSQATKPISGSDYQMVFDEKNGRTWAWLNMSAGARQGLYCLDEREDSVTGPWRFPDFLSVCQLTDGNLNSALIAGITRDGVFLYADVAAIGDFTPPAYTTALPAACAETSSAPSPNPGVPYVGVSADGQQFKTVLNGQTLSLATPWSQLAVGDVTCTRFYNNARLSIIELAEMDTGEGAIQKEWFNLRSIWTQNSCAYIGVYANASGVLTGGWRGLAYPSIDWIHAIGGESSTIKIRLIIVTFNGQNALLSGANVDYFGSVLN